MSLSTNTSTNYVNRGGLQHTTKFLCLHVHDPIHDSSGSGTFHDILRQVHLRQSS